ncbi:hypothetical protein HELRODRAFT_178948 [Helobdella robusta]|uniref:WSC domain-containing protein n=1 Tax=Helobdella robusta TaxID=6412 RepID=T1FDY0_HELRO|nr:hypothetical protein HELRODRAFT_178948 [Helobdella robusta]ESN95767.1 hypothetical protein HELRODRAFT_178948 [Helobdella robusta]
MSWGLMIYFRSDYKYKKINLPLYSKLEAVAIRLKNGTEVFFDELISMLEFITIVIRSQLCKWESGVDSSLPKELALLSSEIKQISDDLVPMLVIYRKQTNAALSFDSECRGERRFCREIKRIYKNCPKIGPQKATETYIGCYREVLAVNAGIVDSYDGCKMLCRNEVTPYIALHEGNECYCVARAKYAVNSKFCNLKCKSGEDGCGGDKYYSLFSIKATTDYNHSLLDINMNVKAFHECHCGYLHHDDADGYPFHFKTKCNAKCPGDDKQICDCMAKYSKILYHLLQHLIIVGLLYLNFFIKNPLIFFCSTVS